MGMPEIKSGTFTSAGTPVIVNLDLGFVPDWFRLIKGATTNPNIYTYIKELGDAATVKMTGSTGAHTYESSNPITSIDDGSISTATVMGASGVVKDIGFKGFTVPAAIQTTLTEVYWLALRQGA